MAGHHAEHARQTATLRWVALGILIPNTFFVEAALGRLHGAVTVPSKTMCRQTLTTLDGTERHRRFYLAVPIGRVLRPINPDDEHAALGRECRALSIPDEKADLAISMRMTQADGAR